MHLSGFIQKLFCHRIPFVSYRLPYASEAVTLAGGFFSQDERYADSDCFVLAPFHRSGQEPLRYYLPFFAIQGWEADMDFEAINEYAEASDAPDEKPFITDFETYGRQFDSLMQYLKAGELKKVVLTRMECVSLQKDVNPGQLFEKMCRLYPSAFTYVFYDDGGQLWLGASPETLLETNEKGLGNTMSLAGTRSLETTKPHKSKWTNKEKEEQQYVTDYIQEKLQQSGARHIHSGPRFTKTAGKLAHLCTPFTFTLPEGLNPIKLALNLHPTPAVCGLPADMAKSHILRTEKHQRSLYTGFLGPVNSKGRSHLFVNLRCMQISGRNACLYAGGGLTLDSDRQQEWEETQNKLLTMKSILQE